jgi:long-chain fatty acid transport protein
MKQVRKSATTIALFALLCSLTIVPAAHATNGMNMEGYGPIATGMGGASMAYDNGTAAMMNNPATLSLMESKARLDLAIGFLGPNVTSSKSGESDAKSSGDLYMMPAFGYARKGGKLTYGLGVFAQGGMGTEYAADSFLAAGSGEKVRSEVSVGRVLIPVAYDVNDKWKVGGSLDFVWAEMDLKMALSGAQFLDMAGSFGGSMTYGSVSGSMMNAFGQSVAFGIISNGQGGNPIPVTWGRFDFSDGSDFSGKAKGTGFAGKLGAVYQASKNLSFGFAYHSKTAIGDLEASGANVTFNANVDNNILNGTWNPGVSGSAAGTYTAVPVPLTGKIQVKDFQWPQMIGVGTAYQASSKLMVVFDYKWINWADTMKNFKMTFTADANQAGLGQGFANTVLDATMYQNWKDQNVFMLGAGYNFTDAFTGRIGFDIANNPIPDKYENPLFPAIVKNHYMLGAGYAFSKASSIDFSFTYAPEVSATNGQGVKTTHSQMNEQIMYSYRF